MNELMAWNMIIGFLLPNVISVVQQPRFTPPIRACVTAVACIIGGVGTSYFNGEFDATGLVSSMLTIGVAAITFYKGFWKPTGVAPALENATSKTPPTSQQMHPEDGPNLRPDPNADKGAVDPLYVVALVILILVLLFVVTRMF